MEIAIWVDNTLPLSLEPLCSLLNASCENIEFSPGAHPIRLDESLISNPASYRRLPKEVLADAKVRDWLFLATSIPYDNNFFFDCDGNSIIVSFNGWNLLTDLPATNGLVYFIASVLCDECGIGSTHEENTGCVNDFWWDKTGVDSGMRAAFVCAECRSNSKASPEIVRDIQSLLDLLSQASRSGRDVLSATVRSRQPTQSGFDAFLCHNGDEKPAIRKLNAALKKAGVRTWLDEDEIALGLPWQPELERQIADIRAACVIVGDTGLGPWQNMEIRAFLSELVNRQCPVIPVILPKTESVPELPIFLRQMTWVDLRKNYEKNFGRLVAALRPREIKP